MCVRNDDDLPEVAAPLGLDWLLLHPRQTSRRDHRLDSFLDSWASLWLESHPDAVQLGDGRLAVVAGSRDFPLRGFTRSYFHLGQVSLNVSKEVIDRLDSAARRTRLKHVAVAPLRYLFGVGGRLWRGGCCRGRKDIAGQP